MNIYCFSTLSFAKLQFKSVINKAFHKHGVASFTDAWIETALESLTLLSNRVASFTDAWIETSIDREAIPICRSHLLQMRGLKRGYRYDQNPRPLSHLLQMRGLKLSFRSYDVQAFGRIFYRCVD